jgi:hypothetical protein
MAIKKTVFIGDDNTFVLTFSDVDAAGVETLHDFTGTYSMLLTLVGSGIAETEYASLVAGQVIDISLGSGRVRFKLGGITGLAAGEYPMRVRYKTSSGDTAPTQIVHEADSSMKVTIKVAAP